MCNAVAGELIVPKSVFLNKWNTSNIDMDVYATITELAKYFRCGEIVIARKAMEDKDIEGTHNNILKAQKIITEFQTTLDMENGGELAQRLYSLYAYLHKKLVSANINKSFEDLDEVLEHLKDLRNTWLEAIKIANQEKAQNGEVENSEEKTHSWSVGEE